MNKLSKATLIIGLISLITAIIHKSLITNTKTYLAFTGMAMTPFIIFFLVVIVHFFHGILSNLSKKNFKQLLISFLISVGFFVLWVIIMLINKELFMYAT